jgi:hypothetical protein
VATLEDLEARIAALGANKREHGLGLAEVKTGLAAVKSELAEFKIEFADFRQETRGTFRSIDEQLIEIKDLIVGRRNGH